MRVIEVVLPIALGILGAFLFVEGLTSTMETIYAWWYRRRS